MNTPSRHLVNFEIYQGKSLTDTSLTGKTFGKATAPLVEMINNMSPEVKCLPFHFYFDNLFTSFNLLIHLQNNGYGGTGTIRENRIPKNCPLPSKKEMLKEERGKFHSAIDRDNGLFLCKWNDNSVVCAASNTCGMNPVTNLKRYSQQAKKHIQVPHPSPLTEYNRYMGGIDRMDQNIGQYRKNIRNRKWYWPLFTWLLDVAIHNAWLLYRTQNEISHLNFRREVVQVYLKRYSVPPKGPGRNPSLTNINDLRYDRLDHLIQKVSDEKGRRCAGSNCKTKARTQCRKCDVGLCLDCFIPYHTI